MASHHEGVPSDLICQKCKNVLKNPYQLPCKHSLCLCPCITNDENAEVVQCPLCNLRCNLEYLVPDTDRRDRVDAVLATQSMLGPKPQFQPPVFQQVNLRPLYSNSNSLLSHLAQCQLCHKMVFGLEYFPCFEKSICAYCQRNQFDLLTENHIKKIQTLQGLKNHLDGVAERLQKRAKILSPGSSPMALHLDNATAIIFNKITESTAKAEKAVEAQYQKTEEILRNLNEKMGRILPGIISTPDQIERLNQKRTQYKDWQELKRRIEQNSKLISQANEELLRLGTEKCILNQEGINKIMKELESFSFIIGDMTANDHGQPSSSFANSEIYRNSAMTSSESGNHVGNFFA